MTEKSEQQEQSIVFLKGGLGEQIEEEYGAFLKIGERSSSEEEFENMLEHMGFIKAIWQANRRPSIETTSTLTGFFRRDLMGRDGMGFFFRLESIKKRLEECGSSLAERFIGDAIAVEERNLCDMIFLLSNSTQTSDGESSLIWEETEAFQRFFTVQDLSIPREQEMKILRKNLEEVHGKGILSDLEESDKVFEGFCRIVKRKISSWDMKNPIKNYMKEVERTASVFKGDKEENQSRIQELFKKKLEE